MSTPNPYRQRLATQPPLLAGRQQLKLVETSVRTSGNRRQSFQALYGPRGVGKTVLLDRYAAIAIERDLPADGHVPLPTDDHESAQSDQLLR